MGDVKLAGVLGLFLGRAVAVAILAGVLAGTIVGGAVMARVGVEQGRKTAVPFGPFLAVGGLVGPVRRSGDHPLVPARRPLMRRAGSRAWRSRQAPLAVGVLVALLAALALTVTHHAPRPAIPADRAVQTALRDAKTRQALRRLSLDARDRRAARCPDRAGRLLRRRPAGRRGRPGARRHGARGGQRPRAEGALRRLDRV